MEIGNMSHLCLYKSGLLHSSKDSFLVSQDKIADVKRVYIVQYYTKYI